MLGSIALALLISRSPSETDPLRFLATPRPYSDEVNLGLIFSAASKSAIAFLVCPLLRLTRPRLSSASTKFGRSRNASLQSFSAAARPPMTVRARQQTEAAREQPAAAGSKAVVLRHRG